MESKTSKLKKQDTGPTIPQAKVTHSYTGHVIYIYIYIYIYGLAIHNLDSDKFFFIISTRIWYLHMAFFST